MLCSALLLSASSACHEPVGPGLNSPLGGWTYRQTLFVDLDGEQYTCREEGALNFARSGTAVTGRWSVTFSSCVPIHVVTSRVGTGDVAGAAVSSSHANFTLGSCVYSIELHIPSIGGPPNTGAGSVNCGYTTGTGGSYTGYGTAILSR